MFLFFFSFGFSSTVFFCPFLYNLLDFHFTIVYMQLSNGFFCAYCSKSFKERRSEDVQASIGEFAENSTSEKHISKWKGIDFWSRTDRKFSGNLLESAIKSRIHIVEQQSSHIRIGVCVCTIELKCIVSFCLFFSPIWQSHSTAIYFVLCCIQFFFIIPLCSPFQCASPVLRFF